MANITESLISWLIFSLIFSLAVTFLGFREEFRRTFMVSFLTLVTSFVVTKILLFSVRRKRKGSASPHRRHEE